MMYPDEFVKLRESFQLLPGIGEKSAERYVYTINDMDLEKVEEFANNLVKFKKVMRKCKICGHLTNSEVCNICSNENRDKSVICVVEDSKSVFMIERTTKFKGYYHVLGGLISPIDEVEPEDINLNSLINDRLTDDVKEVLLAINPSVPGELTSLYIQRLLKDKSVTVSRLSYGIPMGADIDYLDPITIVRAIDDRKFVS